MKEKGMATELLTWIRLKGGINPNTRSADVEELTQKESGFKGKSSLIRKNGRSLDELAQEWSWENGGREVSTDELADALKDAVHAKKRGIPRVLGLGSTEQEINNYIEKQEKKHYQSYDEESDFGNEGYYPKVGDRIIGEYQNRFIAGIIMSNGKPFEPAIYVKSGFIKARIKTDEGIEAVINICPSQL
jgi:hypothetical protein